MNQTNFSFQHGTRTDLLKCLPKGKVCAELGVFRGDFSADILEITRPQRLYLVDIWQGTMRSGDRNGENIFAIDMAEEMDRVRTRFQFAPVEVVKAKSWAWLTQNPGTLDWCYIDTSHDLETTRLELSAAREAVKPGGFICGHDHHVGYFPGVVQAVEEFVGGTKFNCEVWDGDKLPSFLIHRS